jgi:hypothetical protein
MDNSDQVSELDDRQVIRTLAEVSAELNESHEASGDRPASVAEARAALAAVIESGPPSSMGSEFTEPTSDTTVSVGRDVLRALLADPDTAAVTHDIVAFPPGDHQMTIEQLIGDTALIAALITWLQLKVKFKITRSPEGTKMEVEASKEALDSKNIGKILDLARRALGLGG